MASTYNKPFLPVDAQLDQLAERGLSLGDRDAAHRELQAIGYYRLSGYWYPFRKPAPAHGKQRPSEFTEGANLAEGDGDISVRRTPPKRDPSRYFNY